MVLAHATEEGAGEVGKAAASSKSLVSSLKSMLAKQPKAAA
jgi:hypothetical protein